MSDQQQFDPLEAIENAQRVEEIDGDEDVERGDAGENLERMAPHESEELEEPVLNAEGEVVPVPEHDPSAFTEPDAEVYDHQTNFGTDSP